MMHITFFPHATSFDNEAGISTGSREIDLSPLGRKQVVALKEAISSEQFDAVFSSDLRRAQETAEGALGDRYQIVSDTRLREINIGDLSGKKDTDTAPLTYQYVETAFPNGESFKDVEERIRDFLTDVSKRYENKRIAIFAHQAPQLAFEVITKNVSWEEALKNDWRNTGAFQYGWDYSYRG